MTGRTLGADDDDISGTSTITFMLDGELLALEGDQWVKDFHVRSLELIWYDADAGEFRSHVYTGDGATPLDYRWEIDGNEIVHAGLGATYRGSISDDGTRIVGGWRPDPGSEGADESAYDVTMRRTS